MLKIEKFEVVGWGHAIRGMRNPLNSWEKSDSLFADDCGDYYTIFGDHGPWPDESYADTVIGKDDLDLMKRLHSAGTDHRKFMRMLTVYMDITAPLYWWKEFDTYKVGTVANSCSTMHKIAEKEFTLEDFSCDHLMDDEAVGVGSDGPFDIDGCGASFTSYEFMKLTCVMLNTYREKYLETKNKKYWWQMIQLLPSSYNQKRTVMLNYEVLSNLYKSRRSHKLDEWHTLCDWVESLPYSELITGKEDDSWKLTKDMLVPDKDSDAFRPQYISKPDTFISDDDRLIISAYTGFLMCDFGELHKFVEKTLGRPVFMHELAEPAVTKEIQEKLKDEWMRICGRTPGSQKC